VTRRRLGRGAEAEFDDLQVVGAPSESEAAVQIERTVVVLGGVDQCPPHAASRHPGQGVTEQQRAEASALVFGMDREALHVARHARATGDREADRATVVDDVPGAELRCGIGDVGQRLLVVAPREVECGLVDGGGSGELPASQPAQPDARRVRNCGAPGQVALHQHQRVDRVEAGVGECPERGGEQSAGPDRAAAQSTCVADPPRHVVRRRNHLVIEQDEMCDVGLVGPATETRSYGLLHGCGVHCTRRYSGNHRSRCRHRSLGRPFAGCGRQIAAAADRLRTTTSLRAVVPDRLAPVLRELAPLAERFSSAGHRLYLVGGTVRDLFVRDLHGDAANEIDLDLTTDARPPDIKRCLDGWADAVWTQGERFGTIGAHRRNVDGVNRIFEITTFRAEAYTDDSRKPHVVFADEIDADLSRRDFTVNAMALELTGDGGAPELIDPFGGTADLAARTLRTPLGPDVSFSDDPLRMLRAARFVAGYQLAPTDEMLDAVRSMASRLEIVSAERIRDELDKLMVVDHPSAGLWFLVDTGLADQFLPELPAMRLEHDPIHRHKDVLTHSIAVVENVRPPSEQPGHVAADPPPFDFRLTRLAALFHDVGKPRTRGYLEGKGTTFHHHDAVGARMTRKRMTALRYSNDDVAKVTELVALHLRFHTYSMGWSDAAVRRYVRDAGDLLAELNVLTRCDCTTRNAKKAARLSRRMDELEERIEELTAAEELASLRPELDGNAVMEHLGLPPGRDVGDAMKFLMEIRLDEGVIGDDAIKRRLDEWWAERIA